MAEIWGAAIAVGGAALSGYAASKKDKGDKAHDKEMTRESARWNAALSEFEAQQTDYYQQLNRQRKQRGLDNFRQFSQLGKFAPEYAQQTQAIELPKMPTAEEAFTEKPPVTQNTKPSGRSTVDKIIDPLGLF